MQESRSRNKEPLLRKALIMLVVCISITGACAYLLKFGVTKWKYLNMQDSEVSGTIHINPDIIHIALSEFKGENLYLIEDQVIREKIAQHARVKDVRIQRIFPNTIKVIIDERLPIAYLQADPDEFYLIDDQGVLLEKVLTADELDLPIICEKNVRLLVNMI